MINLYIDKEYCLSIEQLKSYFKNLSEGTDIYLDLLDYAKYGDLSKWLYEHNEDQLAENVDGIDATIGDSEYMNVLSEIFGSTSSLSKPPFSDCFLMGKIDYELIDDQVRISFPVTILKSVNENYLITIESSWDKKSDNINTFNYISGEVIQKTITLSAMPVKKISNIRIVLEGFEYNTFKIIPKHNGQQQFLIVNHEQTPRQNACFQVVDSDGRDVLSHNKIATNKLRQIPSNGVSNCTFGYASDSGMVYFVSRKGCQLITTWDKANLDSLTCRLVYNVGNVCICSLIDKTNEVKDFIINDGVCSPAEEYNIEFCKKQGIPYTLRTLGQSDYYPVIISNNESVKPIGYTQIEYIGENNGEAIFLAEDRNNERYIINAQGEIKWAHLYNSIVSPTFDKSVYIATNYGSKYKMFMLMSNGIPLETYRIKGQLYPTIFNETDTSYTISSHEKYLKSKKCKGLILYQDVNPYFYIKTGIYSQNNSQPTSCNPELYLSSSDEMILAICASGEFSNPYFEDMGDGYIAVMNQYNKNIVILSPTGDLVYTLKQGESLTQRVRGNYYQRCSFGASEGAFIIREFKNLYKALAYDGSEICRFNTEEYIANGFHAGRVVFYDNYKIGYFDEKGISHNIPWKKNRYIYSIRVLANGNIIINYEQNGLEKWILIDIEGNELLSSKTPILVVV